MLTLKTVNYANNGWNENPLPPPPPTPNPPKNPNFNKQPTKQALASAIFMTRRSLHKISIVYNYEPITTHNDGHQRPLIKTAHQHHIFSLMFY